MDERHVAGAGSEAGAACRGFQQACAGRCGGRYGHFVRSRSWIHDCVYVKGLASRHMGMGKFVERRKAKLSGLHWFEVGLKWRSRTFLSFQLGHYGQVVPSILQ